MKKIFLIVFLSVLLFSFFLPVYAGLVPCGLSQDDPNTEINESAPCTFCHFFILFKRIIDFLLFSIVPGLAGLMISIGGFMYIFAFGNPNMISNAKNLFKAVAVGLLIIYGAWAIINLFFTFIGLSNFVLSFTGPDKWFIIRCPL